jgi:hypothetical protein
MLKNMLTKLGLIFTLLFVFPTSSIAINIFSNNDLVIIFGDVKDGDDRQLQEALSPAVKFLAFRGLNEGSYDAMKRLARVVKDANVTTVLHGHCGFTCSRVFLAGKQRMFSGEGRPESHYFMPRGAFFADGSSSSQDYAYLNSNADIPKHLIREYAQIQNRTLMVFPKNAKFSQGATAYGCEGKTWVSTCKPFADLTALSMNIVTTDEVFSSLNLKEAKDIATPAKTEFAKIADAPPIETLGNKCKTETYQDFLKQEKPRAFVVSANNGCYWSNGLSFRPIKAALDNCKKSNTEAICKVYAVDDDIVFTPF